MQHDGPHAGTARNPANPGATEVLMQQVKPLVAQPAPKTQGADGVARAGQPGNELGGYAGLAQVFDQRAGFEQEPGMQLVARGVERSRQVRYQPDNAGSPRLGGTQNMKHTQLHDGAPECA